MVALCTIPLTVTNNESALGGVSDIVIVVCPVVAVTASVVNLVVLLCANLEKPRIWIISPTWAGCINVICCPFCSE